MANDDLGGLAYRVLHDENWIAWVERTWSVRAVRKQYVLPGRAKARLSTVLYTDHRGRVRQPPLTPYAALSFESDAVSGSPSAERHWLELAGDLARDVRRAGLRGALNLPPGIIDARPFRWQGFQPSLAYTYLGPLPHHSAVADPSVRKRVRKAEAHALRFEAEASPAEIGAVLAATEDRQGFSYRLRETHLHDLFQHVPAARSYRVVTAQGDTASAGVRLIDAGSVALDWVQGTVPEALPNGAVQLMYSGVLREADALGASHFDYGGANIATVARAKSSWGLPLHPYVSLASAGVRQALQNWRASQIVRRRDA